MTPRETTITDLDLAAAARADTDVALQLDEDAFRGFYDRTARPLWGYLYRLTGDRGAADDLLQETYYRFLRARVALETDAHRRHYLFRIATNLATDGARRRRTRPPGSGHDPDRIGTEAADAVLDRRIDLSAALARLRVRERAMLWLAYAQGASHEEIGQALGVGTSSVKPLLYRARRRLAALLGRSRPGAGR
jgi:RNA polymerase sigma-70 factor (ECF subfamily)